MFPPLPNLAIPTNASSGYSPVNMPTSKFEAVPALPLRYGKHEYSTRKSRRAATNRGSVPSNSLYIRIDIRIDIYVYIRIRIYIIY